MREEKIRDLRVGDTEGNSRLGEKTLRSLKILQIANEESEEFVRCNEDETSDFLKTQDSIGRSIVLSDKS